VFLTRLLEQSEQYKAKWATLRTLKFDPFVLRIAIVAWLKNTPTNFSFYRNTAPILNNHQMNGQYYPQQKQKAPPKNMQFFEHALVEAFVEREAYNLKKLAISSFK
jgi:hypothetical protein